ncbi:pre-toxin TG domain-containing protein [Bacillus altitudinis]|uniref:pre-toxin TG domain-containing protein n=1 Tax=Bacillus altitudinis TaxID=293387 RepID=UPI0030D9ABCB
MLRNIKPWLTVQSTRYGENIVNELTGVTKRAATSVDPITGEELMSGQRVAAGGMAAAGYIPIAGWTRAYFQRWKSRLHNHQSHFSCSQSTRYLPIPVYAKMKQSGIKKNNGISMNLKQPHPGIGGRHREK